MSAHLSTPLGPLVLRATERGLSSLTFTRGAAVRTRRAQPAWFRAAATFLAVWLAGRSPRQPHRRPWPLDVVGGTPFQRRVWLALQQIPWGEVRTYAELARALGTGPRAIGQACARNPIPLILPCHRVVAASGLLGGYSQGLWRKIFLLRLEGRRLK